MQRRVARARVVVRWDPVSEDGVGGSLGMTEQVDVRAVARKFDHVEGIDLVSCGRRGCPGCWPSVWYWLSSPGVGFLICVGVSHVCSSRSSHVVFSLTMVRGHLDSAEWCLSLVLTVGYGVGLALLREWAWPRGVGVFYGFRPFLV
jgi:hypothetical protein